MWDDDDLTAPVDPWAGAMWTDDTLVVRTVPDVPTRGRRPYGAVYCVQTADDADKYVGMAGPRKGRDGRRIPCSPGRRVDEHRDDQTWGAEILPGRLGYRVLEWVPRSGLGDAYDAADLRYREALWIRRVNPTANALRPTPVPPEAALQRKATRPPAVRRRRPFAWFRTVSFALWCALYLAVLVPPLAASGPLWAPWLLAPALSALFAWSSLWSVRRAWDRLTNPRARPPARRTRRRRRRWLR